MIRLIDAENVISLTPFYKCRANTGSIPLHNPVRAQAAERSFSAPAQYWLLTPDWSAKIFAGTPWPQSADPKQRDDGALLVCIAGFAEEADIARIHSINPPSY